MKYSPRFRLLPTAHQRKLLDWQRDTVRQVYNDALHRYNQLPEDDDRTVKQRVQHVRDQLPELKDRWSEYGWNDVYSTVLQKSVERIQTNIENLGKLKRNGYAVGELRWKSPRDCRSFTYRQRGFELDEKSGPTGRGVLRLSKVKGTTLEIPVRLHRPLPDHDRIKEVAVKKDRTGAWYASFCIETAAPE